MLFAAKHAYNMNASATTVYFSPIHGDDNPTETLEVMGVIPVACTMTNMAIKVSSGIDAGVTASFTLRKGTSIGTMANTTLGCSVTLASTFCSGTDSISMNAGDIFDLKLSYNAGSSGPDDTFLTTLICN
jgi:hypothetical protein